MPNSLVVSATVHVVVIGLAVALTAGPTNGRQLPPQRPPILIYNPPRPDLPTGHPGTGVGTTTGRPSGPLTAPTVTPPGLPSIDEGPIAFPGPASGADTVWDVGGGARQGDLTPSPGADVVEVAAAPIPGGPTPHYPEALRSAGVEGQVTLEFVVDTTGRVDAGSIHVLASTADAFVASVRDALAGTRYHPALVGGRPVRQLVRQAFAFSLTR